MRVRMCHRVNLFRVCTHSDSINQKMRDTVSSPKADATPQDAVQKTWKNSDLILYLYKGTFTDIKVLKVRKKLIFEPPNVSGLLCNKSVVKKEINTGNIWIKCNNMEKKENTTIHHNRYRAIKMAKNDFIRAISAFIDATQQFTS